MQTSTLYRPVGPGELELLEQTSFAEWPPRLLEQPIFYPVTNEQYAVEITQKWNVPDFGVGYVTRFQVRSEFLERYKIQTVGGDQHTEYWIPAGSIGA